MSKEITTVYGVQYANGRVDWEVATWFGNLSTVEARQSFTEQYTQGLELQGVTPDRLIFLSKEKTVTCSEPVVIEDDPQEPDPLPEEQALEESQEDQNG